jgi:hypothetical protein
MLGARKYCGRASRGVLNTNSIVIPGECSVHRDSVWTEREVKGTQVVKPARS